MPVEIERKFLVRDDGWKHHAGSGRRLCQGYVAHGDDSSVRVRIVGNQAGERAFLTIKGTRAGLARPEFEYEIPLGEAQEMLHTFCPKHLLTKTRYRIRHDGMIWEVDVFEGRARGLVLAEVELSHIDQVVTLPSWVGREVTDDPRYHNSSIALDPPLETSV